MNIDKTKILNELKSQVQSSLSNAQRAFGTTRAHVSNTEMKAEGKHDTRSIEAGYLAGALEKRVAELEHEISLLDEINLTHDNSNISVGSLVEIELNQNRKLYFISSSSGGTVLQVDDFPILIISAFSPLGAEVVGLCAGDSFEIENRDDIREYQIISIW